MVTCWASILSGCGKQSAEHYVTRGLWSDTQITISGFDWQKGDKKTLPVAALEANILCHIHNGRLSEIDSEAIRIFKFIGASLEDIKNGPPEKKPLFPERYRADGRLFERWCAKTLIDFVCVEKSNSCWHDTGSPLLEPPEEVVKAIFGISKFKRPMGLYLAQETTQTPQEVLREEITVQPLFHPSDKGLVGGFLSFRDYRFLIWLTVDPIEDFSAVTRNGAVFGESNNRFLYHLDELKVQVNHVVRYKVILRWS